MDNGSEVASAVYHAIDELNAQLDGAGQLVKSQDTILAGNSGKLDSLGLVNLIVGVEEQIEERTGVLLSLADAQALAQETSPFETVGTLIEYVTAVLSERARV